MMTCCDHLNRAAFSQQDAMETEHGPIYTIFVCTLPKSHWNPLEHI